jgi:hypothetical protein
VGNGVDLPPGRAVSAGRTAQRQAFRLGVQHEIVAAAGTGELASPQPSATPDLVPRAGDTLPATYDWQNIDELHLVSTDASSIPIQNEQPACRSS